jgi:CheY-like chemotaxis protein
MKSADKSIQVPKASLSILLADDDCDDQFFFDKALKALPISTHLTTVHDGEHLMNYLNENSEYLPSVLFLDINMPRKNGFECLFEIKHNEKLKDLPVVMFSTSYPRDMNYERDMINTLLKIGAYDFIRKPDDFNQLKLVISNALAVLIEKN